jgi:hypothetical protein
MLIRPIDEIGTHRQECSLLEVFFNGRTLVKADVKMMTIY